MTTGAPPPNLTFAPSAKILPSIRVQPMLYNAQGYVEHPLQQFGRPGGVLFSDKNTAGVGSVTVPGGFAWPMAGTHEIVSSK